MQVEMIGRDISIGNLPKGTLFTYGETIALKSEYRNVQGACECFIVGSGETFTGGTNSASELNGLYVTPILLTHTKGGKHHASHPLR